ncbi:MAG: heavy metal translocating P-type ATPase [Acidobacteria bacterium]|nr:heavy metal translocating P-type ATPase [Acidobacteriota bacterium]
MSNPVSVINHTQQESAKAACALCGLDAGRNHFTSRHNNEEKIFCCLGCMNVYAILMESGVVTAGQNLRDTELFKRILEMGLISNRNEAPRTAKKIELPADTPLSETIYQVSGMWCSSCAWLIERSLEEEPGVASAEAFFASDLVKIKYYPQFLPPDRIPQRIAKLGYQASEYTGDNEAANAERKDLLLRTGIAAFFWLNIMTLNTALYVGYFERIAESIDRFLPYVLMALATPVVIYSARPITHLAWRALINKTVRMETLLAIGILTAYIFSIIQVFRGVSHVYFDTASAIVTLVLIGKLIERTAKSRTTQAITMLYRMMPKKVRLLAGGDERFVSIEALNVDDVFVVKAGERIPADGRVIEGESFADESLLTGESAPVKKVPGSIVTGGSVNADGVLHIVAQRVGGDSTLAQIIHMVENAMSSKSTIERTVDRISRIFVPIVIVVAALTFLICWGAGLTTPGEAVMRSIAVLVIACPCALGMATPLAITAAIGAASRQGILIGDSSILERIRKIDLVVFDKTGTVTYGDFALQESTTGDSSMPGDHLRLIASLERYSEHPLGRAILRQAERQRIDVTEASEIQIVKGEGIKGQVDGRAVFIGNRRMLENSGLSLPVTFADMASNSEHRGLTVVFYGWDGMIKGALAFGDTIRQEASAVVRSLKDRGIETRIISGDAAATTAWVSESIGADGFIAEARPGDKTAEIEKLQRAGNITAMIGDGINDAPALAQADLGIAVGSGTDIAMKASSVVLMTSSLSRILDVFDLSRKTVAIVRQNLFWAFFYNTAGISLALTGLLSPIFAAGAMLVSSLSVIVNSMRLNRL